MLNKNLPDWFRAYTQIAMLGEISPHVRLIVASLDNEKTCVIRYYFDHVPTEDEIEQTAVIGTEIAANTINTITKLSEECIFSNEPIHKLDKLDGCLYERMERT